MSVSGCSGFCCPGSLGQGRVRDGVWNLCLKAEKHKAVILGSYRLASRNYALQAGTTQTQFKSRLTTPLKEGGIKPQKTGMKQVQTKACEDKRE